MWKRTKKVPAKVGRKKANTVVATAEATTPRTRATLKKEAAEKARREVEEAELRAPAAREAAKRAAREEAHAADEVIVAMTLEVHVPDPPIEPTTARRSLFPQDALQVQVQPTKMTPRRKVLATKVKKTPEKKGGRKKK